MVSVDNGVSNIFIHAESKKTPASPQPNTVNGGTFASTSGWYGGPAFSSDTVDFASDHDISGIFIHTASKNTPASPLPSTTSNGGTFASTHGWYGVLAPSGDLSSDRFDVYDFFSFNKGPASLHNYLMQAYESGGGCSGNVQRVWIAVGVQPDLTAAQYNGTRCTPPGVFSNFSVLASW